MTSFDFSTASQVVDARNPLLYRCEDLETYVGEVESTPPKRTLLLLNKADMLPYRFRRLWADYLSSHDIGKGPRPWPPPPPPPPPPHFSSSAACASADFVFWSAHHADEDNNEDEAAAAAAVEEDEECHVHTRMELLHLLETIAADMGIVASEGSGMMVGLVGYPNVGKSSTINSLLGTRKTMVGRRGVTGTRRTVVIANGGGGGGGRRGLFCRSSSSSSRRSQPRPGKPNTFRR